MVLQILSFTKRSLVFTIRSHNINMESKPVKKSFVQGAIAAEFIGNSISKHQSKTSIGAHNIFLGQVRADEIDGKRVAAVEYSAYEEMAEQNFHEIRESAFEKYELTCLHIYHSLGVVRAGESVYSCLYRHHDEKLFMMR